MGQGRPLQIGPHRHLAWAIACTAHAYPPADRNLQSCPAGSSGAALRSEPGRGEVVGELGPKLPLLCLCPNMEGKQFRFTDKSIHMLPMHNRA